MFLRCVVEAMSARGAHMHAPQHSQNAVALPACRNWTGFMPSKAREHKRLGSLAKGWEVSKRARALRRVDRRHAAVCDKAPGQPPLRPEAIVNLLAITFWATFVLWPLATWVLEYS